MSRYKPYSPEQAYLLPANVADELGSDHLCFFVRQVVRRLDLSVFEQSYSAEGGLLYAPELMLSVWLYAYATGMTSARRLSQRLGEDLALRYLAGGARVDNWALSAFRRRHGLALNNAFTQVLEMARSLGLGKLGRVAIDSTRIKANASRDRIDTEQTLRNERAKLRRNIRRWQQACDKDDSEPAGLRVAIEQADQKLDALPQRLERLRKSGLKKLSRTDEDARFLRSRRGFELGYTGEIAMSEDHLIVAQRVTQQPTDNASLPPMVEKVKAAVDTRRDGDLLIIARTDAIAPEGFEAAIARLFSEGIAYWQGVFMADAKTVLGFAKKHDAKILDLRFTDIPGLWHHVSYPIEQLRESSFEEGFGIDGSSIRGWAPSCYHSPWGSSPRCSRWSGGGPTASPTYSGR